ncbi:MAG: fructosamine kinase family protein [Bacteriovoracaceae bacterium]|nr:fructosamine kinase family protein [Bacteriovoracaceae bacterium]
MYSKQIKTEIQEYLGHDIVHSSILSGGSIGSTLKLDMSDSRSYVLKINPKIEMVKSEVDGLNELRKTGEIKVPEIHLYKDNSILMEYIRPGSKSEHFFAKFGQALAKLHRHESGSFGWESDGFIGSTPQINTEFRHSWVDFYWQNRLVYQVELALLKGAPKKLKDRLVAMESNSRELLLESALRPCLIHGDLWSGNFLIDDSGEVVLIDPAVYYGHREAELAMTKLFGGFEDSFYTSYNDEYPLPPGFEDRLGLYELYHVLNHYNLFGGHYLDQSLDLMAKYI